MLIGKCPKCETVYSGWALKSPWHQKCDRCGTELKIEDYKKVLQPDDVDDSGERDIIMRMRRN